MNANEKTKRINTLHARSEKFSAEVSELMGMDITSIETAQKFIEKCVEIIGGGFHPDNPMEDYVEQQKRNLKIVMPDKDYTYTFTKAEANSLNKKISKCFDFLGDDIYRIGIEKMHEIFNY